ncbi:MAG TPA: site-2 protease family protein [Gemmatimonadales bacterium]|nr:site-2 protease family protein [Gemmatimonadales bacterium]
MLVFAMVAHEFAHAVVAHREGDDTAYMLGRVTLNPLPHIDPWMSIFLPLLLFIGSHGAFTFGGARPVPVNPRKFRNFRRGDILVSAAGVATNFVLAFVWALVYTLLGLAARAVPGGAEVLADAQQMVFYGIWINLLLCFFNLIPIPPLDGSHLLYHALPPRLGLAYRRIARVGYLPLLALLFFFPRVTALLLTPATSLLALLTSWVRPFTVALG